MRQLLREQDVNTFSQGQCVSVGHCRQAQWPPKAKCRPPWCSRREFPVLKHVWEQTKTLQSECSGCLHANAAKIARQSCFLIPIWATVMQTRSEKLYCAPLHKQKLFKDWPSFWRGKSSIAQRRLVFYYTVFLQWPSTWKQLSSWAILALTSRSTLMSSICKKKKKKRGRGEKSLWSEK